MVKDIIRWGVIGAGGIARGRTIPEGILPAENAELVAIYDVNPEINADVAQKFQAESCSSKEELLSRSDIDAVYIATPVYVHHDQTLAAAKAGKHVLCEKPLAMSVDEAKSMAEACKAAGVKMGVGFMMRFHASHIEALRMIEADKIGKLVLGRAQLSCWYPPIKGAWRQELALGGGGSLADMGGHCIDLLEMFFGPVKSVYCQTANLIHDYESEDSATVLLEFESGAHGIVDAFFCVVDAGCKNRLEIYGSKGSILGEGTLGQASDASLIAYLADAPSCDGSAIEPKSINIYRAEIEEFGRAIIENREPSNGVARALRSQEILAACYESARSHKAVEV